MGRGVPQVPSHLARAMRATRRSGSRLGSRIVSSSGGARRSVNGESLQPTNERPPGILDPFGQRIECGHGHHVVGANSAVVVRSSNSDRAATPSSRDPQPEWPARRRPPSLRSQCPLALASSPWSRRLHLPGYPTMPRSGSGRQFGHWLHARFWQCQRPGRSELRSPLISRRRDRDDRRWAVSMRRC